VEVFGGGRSPRSLAADGEAWRWHMSRMVRLLMAALAFMAAANLTACKKEGPAEKAGKEIDKAVDKAGDAVEDAGDKVKDAVD
jgi:hypothetical protein